MLWSDSAKKIVTCPTVAGVLPELLLFCQKLNVSVMYCLYQIANMSAK